MTLGGEAPLTLAEEPCMAGDGLAGEAHHHFVEVLIDIDLLA